ncbi:MAG: hypothetical protein ACPGR5_08295 [Chitinophagales bacterium]
MKNSIIAIILIGVISLSSCTKDRDFNGERGDIEKFLGVELVESLDEIGFKMYYGEKPPQIEGDFLVNSADLKSSTVPNDPDSHTFNDLKISFKNQNNKELTIDYQGDELDANSVGIGTFIAGNGKYFTVAMKTETTKDNGGKAESAFVITGKMTKAGIVDVEVAVFLIKIIEENPNDKFIPENTGRVIVDGNGLATRV